MEEVKTSDAGNVPEKTEAAKGEAARLVRIALSVGIPAEVLRLSKEEIAGLFDESFYAGHSAGAIAAVAHLYDKRWIHSGEFLICEGGDRFNRMAVAYRALFRAILALTNSGVDTPPVVTSACDLLLKFNGYDKGRFELMEKLRESCCLYISEIDKDMQPNAVNEGPLLLESLFSYRVQHKLPTILSVTNDLSEFHWVGWGQTIQTNMDQGRKRWPNPSNIWRMRIKGGQDE